MKLNEHKTNWQHYFLDEQGRRQGQYKDWHDNGQQRMICHFRDDKRHGEYKDWWSNGQQWEISHRKDGNHHGEYKCWDESGKLYAHAFDIDDEEVVDFLKNPELYPTTPEEKTIFALKYGSAPFVSDSENK